MPETTIRVGHDGTGKQIAEIDFPEGSTMRLTLVPAEESWCGSPCIRLQMVGANGPLRGPDVPLARLDPVVGAALRLIQAIARTRPLEPSTG